MELLDLNMEDTDPTGESEVKAITIQLGLSGYLMGVPFWVFHGFFVLITISLAAMGAAAN